MDVNKFSVVAAAVKWVFLLVGMARCGLIRNQGRQEGSRRRTKCVCHRIAVNDKRYSGCAVVTVAAAVHAPRDDTLCIVANIICI